MAIGNFAKSGHMVLDICVWADRHTDRQTDKHAHYNTPPPYWEIK